MAAPDLNASLSPREMNRLTNTTEIEEARRRIAGLLDLRGEWLCAEARGGASANLRRGEWELRATRGALFLTYWGERGARAWRVSAWDWTGAKLLIEASRRAGAERTVLEFVPRARARDAAEALASARRAACEHIARLVCEATACNRVEQARLSAGARRGEPGRYARIVLRRGRGRLAVSAPVAALGPEDADAFLSSTLIWFARLEEHRGGGEHAGALCGLLLVAPRGLAHAAAERAALLREGLRRVVEIYEVDEEMRTLSRVRVPELRELLDATPRFIGRAKVELSETAESIVALAPESIDVVRARRGETLRFRGLAFARVRRVAGREHAWFGAGRMRPLDEASWPEFLKLVGELNEHRRADAADRRHALYRAAPEAWLESLLRRDVTRLDPGLRLAPVHAQLRASPEVGDTGARPVDLVALRRDGRLVVIELKVSEDASLPLQGADYWRRIMAQHRAGHIRRARLFGDAFISDDPPLVYLVAPLLRFHRAFQTLARCIKPEIEIYRFDLNENWRAGVRVARRARVV